MHLTKYAAIAGALATPLAFAAPASATAGGTNSAFGISAGGPVPIPPTPAVSSTTQPNDKSLAALPPNTDIEAKLLHVTATSAYARASVGDLKVPKAQLSAELITARCVGDQGSSHLVNASLAGHTLARSAPPNTTKSVPIQGLGTISVVLNKQAHNADGSFTVTAIEVSLPLGPGKTETVSVSSATCGTAASPEPSPSEPTAAPPTSNTPPGEAPAPTPVRSDLPVTG